jgi:hypothetical protein
MAITVINHPKFEIGDRVKIGWRYPGTDIEIGATGIIIGKDISGGFDYEVSLDNPPERFAKYESILFRAGELVAA